jgi:hypothetical protein
VGAVLVAAAILGGILLLVVGGDDDNGSTGASPEDIAKLQDRVLKKTLVNPDAGISVRRPSAWTDSKSENAITLRSKNRCVAMILTAPTQASQSKKLLDATIDSLRQAQKGVTFRRAGGGSVGGIPTTSFTVALKNPKGDRVTALFSVGRGQKYAYLTETVLGNTSCKRDLAAAQLITTSIEYTK